MLLSKVKTSPKLIKEGKLSYEWARSHMQILDNTVNRYKKSKPLKGVTLGFCLHITKETSVLLMGAKELGATVCHTWFLLAHYKRNICFTYGC
jgi:adenosylhomocysteinase